MARKSRKKDEETDPNATAASIVSEVTGLEPPTGVYEALLVRQAARRAEGIAKFKAAVRKRKKNPAAVALGRLGGLKGGAARAAALTPAKRTEIAQKAAASRWGKKAAPAFTPEQAHQAQLKSMAGVLRPTKTPANRAAK